MIYLIFNSFFSKFTLLHLLQSSLLYNPFRYVNTMTQERNTQQPKIIHENVTKITTLDNGIRVASENLYGSTGTVGVYIDAGSIYENESNNGTAHFLEHMAFKGTKTRTCEDIEILVENMGAQLNAYTSRELTAYFAKSFKNDMPVMVDIISDILQNSKLEVKHIERERSVILKEKEVVESNREEIVFDLFHYAAFNGTPLANTILGETKNIKTIQRKDLIDYIQTHYISPRIVVAASGPIEHEELVSVVEKSFRHLPTESNFDYSYLKNIDFIGSDIRVDDRSLDKVWGGITFRGPSWTNPDYIPFLIIQNFIGSWEKGMEGRKSSTPTLSDLSDEYDLCESYSAFSTCYNHTGLFGVYYETSYQTIGRFSEELMNEFAKIRSITQEELDRLRNRVKFSYLMQLDGSTAICEEIGRQILTLGRRMTPYEILERLDNVTLDDIQRICDTYLKNVDPVVASYGNLKNQPDYEKIRQMTSSL